ncbi:MAG: prolipoprotein diacylglyceryl transferase [Candidatus Pacebacteria bacterium CG_4_10_14_0_8_um_filter_42_14]|nr:MAG: prolipoprotein diacylglyceryl transferase [Candidatus Pacebacteria bacterium CG_4_10_14_0_8_um_filter_42_14]
MVEPSFSFFGLTIRWYGIFIASGGVLAFNIIEKQSKKYQLSTSQLNKMSVYAVIGGFLGARMWHLATDWHLYANNLIEIFAIWRGGMSIFGAVAGGLVALVIYSRRSRVKFWKMSDLLIFGLPLGQIVGRLGNWVNGELYGLPTNLPWKLFVAPENRLAGFETASYYHPLFLYEIILLSIFLIFVWLRETRAKNSWQVGSGKLTLLFIAYYSFIRILLDFLRLDKATAFGSQIGINQVVCIIAFLTVVIIWKRRYKKP